MNTLALTWMGWFGLKASLIVCVAAVLARYLAKDGPNSRCWIWRATFAVIFAIPLLSLWLPPFELVWLAAVPPPPPMPAGLVSVESSLSILAWLFIGCTAVAGLRLVTFAKSLHGLRRIRRGAQPATIPYTATIAHIRHTLKLHRPVALFHSDALTTPISWGIFRTIVVLPTRWRATPDQRTSHALWHELGHARRHDWAWLVLQRVCCHLLWWNPLVGMAGRQLSEETEVACDRLAIPHVNSPVAYARTLLHAALPQPTAAMAMAASQTLKRRLSLILQPTRRNTSVNPVMKSVAFCCALLATGLIATGRVIAHNETQEIAPAPAAAPASPELEAPAAPGAGPLPTPLAAQSAVMAATPAVPELTAAPAPPPPVTLERVRQLEREISHLQQLTEAQRAEVAQHVARVRRENIHKARLANDAMKANRQAQQLRHEQLAQEAESHRREIEGQRQDREQARQQAVSVAQAQRDRQEALLQELASEREALARERAALVQERAALAQARQEMERARQFDRGVQ